MKVFEIAVSEETSETTKCGCLCGAASGGGGGK